LPAALARRRAVGATPQATTASHDSSKNSLRPGRGTWTASRRRRSSSSTTTALPLSSIRASASPRSPRGSTWSEGHPRQQPDPPGALTRAGKGLATTRRRTHAAARGPRADSTETVSGKAGALQCSSSRVRWRRSMKAPFGQIDMRMPATLLDEVVSKVLGPRSPQRPSHGQSSVKGTRSRIGLESGCLSRAREHDHQR